MLACLLTLAPACTGGTAPPPVLDELDQHRAWLAACQSETSNYAACNAYCSTKAIQQERSDCLFQLAERAPRWANGDARQALNVAYSVCNSLQDFASQCFRHALHEIGITCNSGGVAWIDDPSYAAGDRWAPWQGCVSRQVLVRQNQVCLQPIRESYHNLWVADDAPLCGQ